MYVGPRVEGEGVADNVEHVERPDSVNGDTQQDVVPSPPPPPQPSQPKPPRAPSPSPHPRIQPHISDPRIGKSLDSLSTVFLCRLIAYFPSSLTTNNNMLMC